MPNRRMNKTIAGYHMMMILSAVDYRLHSEEEKIIREYLFQEFPFHVNLDKQMEQARAVQASNTQTRGTAQPNSNYP